MERLNTAATHAINGLPEDERVEFEKTLEQDPYLTAHVDSFRRVALELTDGMTDIVPAASPIIWDRIVAETRIDQPTSSSPQVAHTDRSTRRNWLAPLVAVAAALAVGVFIGGQTLSASPDMMELAAEARSATGSTTYELENPAGMTAVNASVVVAQDGTGYVEAGALPALTDDRTYQLWVIVGGEVVSAGLLGNDPEVIQFRAEGDIAGMAISNEVAGGVVVSENDPVALWLRDA